MATRIPPFTIDNLRGGINTSDSPTLLPPNQYRDGRNVDFREGAIGSKRRGTAGIDITGSLFDSPVVAAFQHTPTSGLGGYELWGIDENAHIDRRVGGTWAGGVAVSNDFVTVAINNWDANAVSLHGKLFIAAKGSQDRLLVWDGSVLRWAGLAQPPDPTVADTASAGSYTGTRYFRIRYTAQNAAGATLRRSEPTNTIVFTPVGTKDGATITKPTGTEVTTSVYCEGQTHWEVEASLDDILFYRIATVAIGTGSYTDHTAYTTGYATYPLSESSGEYQVPRAARHVIVDEDRVMLAGNYFSESDDSTVWWTPVSRDDGVGNDERIPVATNQFLSLDGLDGGRVTALVPGVLGSVYAFKLKRIHKLVRTGIASDAYSPYTTEGRGCVLRGACTGSDELGQTCVYFLDPSVGLCRIGQKGIEDLARSIRTTWRGRNPDPAIGPRIVYYPELDQVWFTNPTGDPSAILSAEGSAILSSTGESLVSSQTTPTLLVEYEIKYGGLAFHDGVPGTAQTLAMAYNDDKVLKPVIGTGLTPIGGGLNSYLHFADTGTTDSGTAFRGWIQTKPYVLGDLWNKFGIMAGVLLAKAASGVSILVKLIRDFNKEPLSKTADLTPATADEDHVVVPLDNVTMSDLVTVAVEFGDSAASTAAWSLDQFSFKARPEDQVAG